MEVIFQRLWTPAYQYFDIFQIWVFLNVMSSTTFLPRREHFRRIWSRMFVEESSAATQSSKHQLWLSPSPSSSFKEQSTHTCHLPISHFWEAIEKASAFHTMLHSSFSFFKGRPDALLPRQIARIFKRLLPVARERVKARREKGTKDEEKRGLINLDRTSEGTIRFYW